MEMLQLRYFYESARTENFSKTAELFCVPTTSVSASVKRLENELGCNLFDRFANRITLNANGRRLQGSLHTVFRELDGVVEALSVRDEDNRQIQLLVRGMRRKITDLITEYSEKNANTRFRTVFDYSGSDFRDYDVIIDEQRECYTRSCPDLH